MSKKNISVVVLGLFLFTLGLVGCGSQPKAEQKVLKVGSDTAFAPFEFQDDKSKDYVGFDIDLLKAVAKQMKMEVQVQSMNFDGLIPALEASNIDLVVSAMTITDERAKKVAFSNPYYKSGLTMVVKSDNTTITSFKDLEGKKIAVQIGTTGADEAKKVPNATIREFNTAPEAFLELKAGGVDAVVNDMPVNNYYMTQEAGKGSKQVGEPLTAEDYGFAATKKNVELIKQVNTALDELKKNGEYDKIYVQWFGKKPQ